MQLPRIAALLCVQHMGERFFCLLKQLSAIFTLYLSASQLACHCHCKLLGRRDACALDESALLSHVYVDDEENKTFRIVNFSINGLDPIYVPFFLLKCCSRTKSVSSLSRCCTAKCNQIASSVQQINTLPRPIRWNQPQQQRQPK